MSGTIVAQRGREASKKAIQLVWDDASSQVTVTPRDKDRFTIRMRAAVDALQKSEQVEEFSSQFQLLLSILAGWLREHKHSVREGYITLRDGSLAFVVIRSECEYDDDFEDALSELDLAIANDVDLALKALTKLSSQSLETDKCVCKREKSLMDFWASIISYSKTTKLVVKPAYCAFGNPAEDSEAATMFRIPSSEVWCDSALLNCTAPFWVSGFT